ncbi:hypothetical protein P389DRAFT_64643 [Cystobasidium minutum MCA 4210]|uniref:uncharacterized protein n=1 Tax=Cystobasidium minutum MCA 4210 TaxID=1397322 RepID=UPI0034CD48D3|eukprot:jgi/Rhomi1/64643/CE64642_35
MRFTFVTALILGAAAVMGQPILKERNGSASVKDVQCCQQLLSKNEASKAFGGLLAIPNLVGNLGLGCTPIGISAGSQCKSTPVLCSEVYQKGLINLGCSPVSAL